LKKRVQPLRLFALVENLQLELPAFECHQHVAEVLPRNFPAIDNEKRHSTIFVLVPFNPASDNLVSYLQSKAPQLEVLDRQRAPNLLDQPSEQSEKILFGVADNLKLIAGGFAIAKLESIQRHTR